MTQLTIRFDEDLAGRVEREAQEQGLSLNQTVIRLLRRGLGLESASKQADHVGDSLDWFFGSWSEEEAREFDEATAEFSHIDEDLWR